jgi:hypothetical protein
VWNAPGSSLRICSGWRRHSRPLLSGFHLYSRGEVSVALAKRLQPQEAVKVKRFDFCDLIVGTGTRGIPALFPRSLPHDGRQVRISRSAILLSNTPVFISPPRRSSTPCETLQNYNWPIMGAFLRIETLPIVLLCYIGGLHECTPQCSSSRLCI